MEHKSQFKKCTALFLVMLMAFTMIFSILGSTTVSASYSSEIDRLEEEKQNIQNDKNNAGNKVSALRKEKAAWIDQKTALDEKNRLAQEEILNTQKQIEIYNQMIAEKQAEAEAAQSAADETLRVYKKRHALWKKTDRLIHIWPYSQVLPILVIYSAELIH